MSNGNSDKLTLTQTVMTVKFGSPGRIRTYDLAVNSRALYHWATGEKYVNNGAKGERIVAFYQQMLKPPRV